MSFPITNTGDEYVLIHSELCGELTRDGITIDVHIYKGESEPDWILEVVDSENASTVWDDQFPTDAAAMDELMRTLEEGGMKTFNPHYRKSVH